MKAAIAIAILAFLILQLAPAPYQLTTTAVDTRSTIAADPDIPYHIQSVLRRACMDCHSQETRVPWYGRVAPASWMMARDVTEARQAMDLSRWAEKPPAARLALSAAACADVKAKKMPKPQYRMLHAEARLSPQDIEAICGWPKAVIASIARQKALSAATH
ncbi:MAG: heme-binding domain-containing protein [Acidobacteria bacterium]|nr:heme-binding domain-containing protein [Acidobacteriota bacterium]